jgi:hypothetical protein
MCTRREGERETGKMRRWDKSESGRGNSDWESDRELIWRKYREFNGSVFGATVKHYNTFAVKIWMIQI